MPKQASLHKINGKADGRSYYYSQNGGWLSRTINPGMSERVKTAPEFANTRRNGKEFGSIGMLCGGIVRSLSSRWRFILDPVTTGKYVKEVYNLLRSKSGVWGQRELGATDNQLIYPMLNKYSKNDLPLDIASQFTVGSVKYVSGAVTEIVLNNAEGLSFPEGWGEDLLAKGADKVKMQLVALRSVDPTYSADGDNYTMNGTTQMVVFSDATVSVGTATESFVDEKIPFADCDWSSSDDPQAIGLVVLPMKTVGSNSYVMQELCSFHCVAVTEGYTPEP